MGDDWNAKKTKRQHPEEYNPGEEEDQGQSQDEEIKVDKEPHKQHEVKELMYGSMAKILRIREDMC